jgi:hypothetical protein
MPIKLTTMSKIAILKSPRAQTVLGHDIPRVRLTTWGIFWIFTYLVFPVLLLGNMLDLAIQAIFGWCVGVWCVLPG